MSFIVRGLPASDFEHLFGLCEAELAVHNATRVIADKPNAFPDRIGLRDADPGETLILTNYTHQPADSPYRASHAVYVREGASETGTCTDAVPEVMQRRFLSLRAFDNAGHIIAADVVPGTEADPVIRAMLQDKDVAYIHVHYAARGCYSGRIERA